MKKISRNTKETEKIAQDFLNKLKQKNIGATIVGMYGDLGAGKTTFVQSVGKMLNIKRKVNSPTYVIIKNYKIHPYPASPLVRGGRGGGLEKFKYLFHLDAYRLKNESELLQLNWSEIIGDKDNLIFIEWPERIIKAMPKKHHQIHISHLPTGQAGTKEEHRKFEIKKA